MFIFLSEKRGSNPRPRPWQGRALPTELFSHSHYLLERQHLLSIADANVLLILNYTNVFLKKTLTNHNQLITKIEMYKLFFLQHSF